MTGKITYFGLEIVDGKYVREADIMKLPFGAFWRKSAIGSAGTYNETTGEHFIYLHDWERFSALFIKTGRHRYMPHTPDALLVGRYNSKLEYTYFGLVVQHQKYVLPQHITSLPFYDFWRDYAASKQAQPGLSEATLIHLEDWTVFARRFIELGNSTLAANFDQNPQRQNMTASIETKDVPLI